MDSWEMYEKQVLRRLSSDWAMRFLLRRGAQPSEISELLDEAQALGCYRWTYDRRGRESPSRFVEFLLRQVLSGRRLCNVSERDIMKERREKRNRGKVPVRVTLLRKQPRHEHERKTLEMSGQASWDGICDNRQAPALLVQFKLDAVAWFDGLSDRDKGVVGEAIADPKLSTAVLAKALGVTNGHASRIRRQLAESYARFADLGEV